MPKMSLKQVKVIKAIQPSAPTRTYNFSKYKV